MSETLWVAMIAVGGTAIGAAIAPISEAFKSRAAARDDTKAERLRSAAEFGQAILDLARTTPKDFGGSTVRSVERQAIEARFELARYLPTGAGQVDRFAEYGLAMIADYNAQEKRLIVARHVASQILDWARGDIPPEGLELFEVEVVQNEIRIV